MNASDSEYSLSDFSIEHDASVVPEDVISLPKSFWYASGASEHDFLNYYPDLGVSIDVQYPGQASAVGMSSFDTDSLLPSVPNYSTDSQEHSRGNHRSLDDAIDYALGLLPPPINQESTGAQSFMDISGPFDWRYGAASMGTLAADPSGHSMSIVSPIAKVDVLPPSSPALVRVRQARHAHRSLRSKTRYGSPSNANRDTVSFRTNGASKDGVSLKNALTGFDGAAVTLVEADELVLRDPDIGVNITLHVLWPGQKPWKITLRTKTSNKPPRAISRAELAKRLARALISFTKNATPLAQNSPEVVPPGSTLGCPAPGSLRLDQIFLKKFYPVTKGAWQVDLSYKPAD